MKNIKQFPFIRNQYFFGKLLSVSDFETEQTYFNNKRRILNRLLFGMGIVCGFTVTRVDGNNLLIESGLAIDGEGREIVLEQSMLKKLSTLDGFYPGDVGIRDNLSDKSYIYLCIEYNEENFEPVHSIADKETQFNKTLEGYKLYLTNDEPAEFKRPDFDSIENILRHSITENTSVNLETNFENKIPNKLYLARIDLVRFEDAYEIEHIEQLPFKQYIFNQMNYRIISEYILNEINLLKQNLKKSRSEVRTEKSTDFDIRSGIVTVDIPKDNKAGDVFLSEYLSHGLGALDVQIFISLRDGKYTYTGDSTIFSEADNLLSNIKNYNNNIIESAMRHLKLETTQKHDAIDYAVRIDRTNGFFQIGVRLKAPVSKTGRLSFDWTAVHDAANKNEYTPKKGLEVQPGIVRVKRLGSTTFTALIDGSKTEDISWSVKDDKGGRIDKNGRYIAPDETGIFEINATSTKKHGLKASAYVMVVIGQ